MDIELRAIKQYKLCSHNSCRCVLEMETIVKGVVVGTITGTYDEVLNIKKLREIFGYDKIPDISKAEFAEIKLSFDKSLLKVETQVIYLYQAWEENHNYYILGNYKVDKDNVSEVINHSVHSRFKLRESPDNKTLCRHMMSRYFKLLKHDVYSKILLCISILAMFTTPLQQTNNQPQFATFIRGKFNKGKSSSVKALVNPWNGISYSFEDTEAVLKQALKEIKDILLLIDDMSKSKRSGMTAKNERIIRMSGDTTTSAMKIVGGKIDYSNVGCMTLITGEDLPQLQNSSYTRMLILEYADDEVNWDILTELQENTSLTAWFYIRFLQFSMHSGDFVEELSDLFVKYRSDYLYKFKEYNVSNRYIDMCAWLVAMWNIIKRFFECMGDPIYEDDFVTKCERLVLSLSAKYSHKTPSQTFLTALFSLIENNRLNIVSFAEAKEGTAFDIFEKDGMYFIKSGVVYDKIKTYYDSLNIDFYESERVIRKDLDSCGLIRKNRDYTTTEFKDKNNKSISGFYLLANNAKDMMEQKGGNIDEHI